MKVVHSTYMSMMMMMNIMLNEGCTWYIHAYDDDDEYKLMLNEGCT